MAPRPLTWVIGGSGLLGSAVRRAVADAGGEVLLSKVPWDDTDAAVDALLRDAAWLPEDGWRMLWCAGAGVVASGSVQLERELAIIGGFLERWEPGARGAVFVASSAGGAYAGSATPPFTEETATAPISAYGTAKLHSEGLFSRFSERTGVPVFVGRISNLYGPGQNLDKGQGLISLLCLAHVTGKPLDIYVSLDTIRDYLFVDDAAAMVLAGLEEVADTGGARIKILANGTSHTIAGVIGELRKITRRRPPFVTAPSASTRLQTADLRMRSVSGPSLQQYARTPFGVGIAACLAAVESALHAPGSAGRTQSTAL